MYTQIPESNAFIPPKIDTDTPVYNLITGLAQVQRGAMLVKQSVEKLVKRNQANMDHGRVLDMAHQINMTLARFADVTKNLEAIDAGID